MKKPKGRISFIYFVLAIVVGISPGLKVYAANLSTPIAKAYYDVLINVIKTHGMSEKEGDIIGNGLAYVALKDFDGNQVPDLYMIRFNNGEESYGGYGRFIESIWSYKNGKAYTVSSKEYDIRDRINHRTVYLTDIENKTYLVHVPAYSHGRGEEPFCNVSQEDIEVYTMENGKLVESLHAMGKWESTVEDNRERVTFTTQDGKGIKKTNEATFNQIREKYTRGIQVCTGGAGAPSMLIDTSSSNQQLKDFYKGIETKAIGGQMVKDTNLLSKLSTAQQDALNKFLLNFPEALSAFNIKNYNDHELISVLQLNQRKGLGIDTYNKNREYIMIKDTPYDPHYISKVNDYTYDLFGVYPDINRTKAKGYFNYLKAKDSYYFPLAEGLDPSRNGIETKEIYQLNNDTYYISFDMYIIDLSTFEEREDDWNKSYRQWSNAAKKHVTRCGTGQAVVKKVMKKGKVGLNLVEFYTDKGKITAKQLATYKEKY